MALAKFALPTSERYTYDDGGMTFVGSVLYVILLAAVVPVVVNDNGEPAL